MCALVGQIKGLILSTCTVQLRRTLSVITVQEIRSTFCEARIYTYIPPFCRFFLVILFITLVCEHFAVQVPVFIKSLAKIIPINDNYIITLIICPITCITSSVLTVLSMTNKTMYFCTVIKHGRSNVTNVSGRTYSNGFCVSHHELSQARH